MTLINGNSNSTSDFYETRWESTIEEVIIPKEKKTTKIKIFALTHIGNYSVSTTNRGENWYETQIISNRAEDKLGIGYYSKKTTTTKLALNQHIEAIWHIHHSCREGL